MIYFISTVEPIPIIDGDLSPWRSTQLCSHFASKQIPTSLITSSFNHFSRSFRDKSKIAEFEEHYGITVTLMPAIAYTKSTSPLRIANYVLQSFWLLYFFLLKDCRRDVIVITVPTIEHLAVLFFKKFKFVIVDYRDLWPFTFGDVPGNKFKKIAGRILQYLYTKILFAAVKSVDEIWTISEGFETYLREKFVRSDISYKVFTHMRHPVALHTKFTQTDKSVTIVYAGLISRRAKVVEQIRSFLSKQEETCLKLQVYGQGDAVDELQSLIIEDDRVEFHGFVDRETLKIAYLNADYGLLAYPNSVDFSLTFPNKVWEYMSHGLPIVHNHNTAILKSELIHIGCIANYNDILVKLDVQRRKKYHCAFISIFDHHQLKIQNLTTDLKNLVVEHGLGDNL